MAHGGEIGILATEERDDLYRRAQGGQGVHLENLQGLDAAEAGVGVFLEQGIEDGAGLVAIGGEDVALAYLLGPLPARQGWLVEGDVADEIEGVLVAAHLLGQFVEVDALDGQLLQDDQFAVGVVPGVEEGVQGGVGLAQGLA